LNARIAGKINKYFGRHWGRGKRIALSVGMCCCRSSRWLRTELNRAAQAALFNAFYGRNQHFQESALVPNFQLFFRAEGCSYQSKNDHVAQKKTF